MFYLKNLLRKKVKVTNKSYIAAAGAGDLLPAAIERFGEILVHGVDIKPGKTFVLGMVQANADGYIFVEKGEEIIEEGEEVEVEIFF